MKTELTQRELELANYIVGQNRQELNRISKDCISPLIAIRKAVKNTAMAIGNTELRSQEPITHEEWLKITRWINDAFYK